MGNAKRPNKQRITNLCIADSYVVANNLFHMNARLIPQQMANALAIMFKGHGLLTVINEVIGFLQGYVIISPAHNFSMKFFQ